MNCNHNYCNDNRKFLECLRFKSTKLFTMNKVIESKKKKTPTLQYSKHQNDHRDTEGGWGAHNVPTHRHTPPQKKERKKERLP